MFASFILLAAALSFVSADRDAFDASAVNWHVVWVGGQSNAKATNSQTSGFPTWNTTDRIQMFCWSDDIHCDRYGPGVSGQFSPASVPIYNENNVGFSQTYANLLLATLPANHGIVIINTAVGGTGFYKSGDWSAPNGRLLQQSVVAMQNLVDSFPTNLGGSYSFHSMLWHQGEHDAGDNPDYFHAPYCTYLQNDLSNLTDYLRGTFKGASGGTPFIDGGMLPYWVDLVNGTDGVMDAIYALNTSRVCTATADSRVLPDFLPGNIPNGDPEKKSGLTGDVIHFNATSQIVMGHEYWKAYKSAMALTTVVPSSRTQACQGGSVVLETQQISQCGS